MASATPPVQVLTTAQEPQDSGTEAWPTRCQLLAAFLCYFGLHIVIRTLLSSSVDLDESEQVLFGQRLSWGYGPDPPLYTWLQIGFFSVFGQWIFSLALLKNLLLFGAYVLTYWNARLITRSHFCGVAAAVSLLFVPQFAWESQRDLTHSVLSSTLAAATLFCFLRSHETKRLLWWVLLGVCAGLGVLSKFNFGFWILGLLVAACSLRDFRPAVLHKGMWLAAMICVLILLPTGLWSLAHPQLAFGAASKLKLAESAGWLKPVSIALRNVIVAIVSFVGPLTLVYLAVFFKAPRQQAVLQPGPVYEKLLLRALLIIVGVSVLLVLCFRATGFRERWFQPILMCTPVLLIALVRDRLDRVRLRRILALGLTVTLAVAVVIPGRILFGAKLHREEPLMRPYDALAAQLRYLVPEDSFVVADTVLLAGNLRLGLPKTTIVTPAQVGLFKCEEPHCLIVWDARRGELTPETLLNWAQTWSGSALSKAQPQYFEATYKFRDPRRMRLGMMVVK